jgi:hypothetical protein
LRVETTRRGALHSQIRLHANISSLALDNGQSTTPPQRMRAWPADFEVK